MSPLFVSHFNTSLAETERSSKKKISKERVEINNIINQLDITDIDRLLHLTAAEHTFFSSSHEISIKVNHILGHKTQLYKFREQKSFNVSSYTTKKLR